MIRIVALLLVLVHTDSIDLTPDVDNMLFGQILQVLDTLLYNRKIDLKLILYTINISFNNCAFSRLTKGLKPMLSTYLKDDNCMNK